MGEGKDDPTIDFIRPAGVEFLNQFRNRSMIAQCSQPIDRVKLLGFVEVWKGEHPSAFFDVGIGHSARICRLDIVRPLLPNERVQSGLYANAPRNMQNDPLHG